MVFIPVAQINECGILPTMEKLSFIERLNSFIDWQKVNQKGLARDAGVSYDVVRELSRRRTKSISVDNAKAVLDALGISFGEVYGDIIVNAGKSDQEFIGVPRYKAHLSAGHGAFNEGKPQLADHIPFTREFFRSKLKRNSADGLMICEVMGESMVPTMGHGDLVMVDTNYDEHAAGLYALNYDGETLVKRVEKIARGYSLISDNSIYPITKIQGNDLEKLELIGKIVWIGRTL
jgi:phage repressor protein C with HTH and peptisase S24 domain